MFNKTIIKKEKCHCQLYAEQLSRNYTDKLTYLLKILNEKKQQNYLQEYQIDYLNKIIEEVSIFLTNEYDYIQNKLNNS